MSHHVRSSALKALGILLVSSFLLAGCVNVKAPERITIGGGESDSVDSGDAPRVSSVEQGQAEVDRAYRAIRRLESRNAELARDIDELKQERSQYKRERDNYRKELEKSREE